MRRFLPIAVVALLGASCASLVDPDPDATPADEFVVWNVAMGEPAPEPRFDGGNGVVEIQGAIGTSDPCYTITERVVRGRARIDLILTTTAMDVICIQILGRFGFEAVIGNVQPGPYHVRVLREYRGATDVIQEGAVRVR